MEEGWAVLIGILVGSATGVTQVGRASIQQEDVSIRGKDTQEEHLCGKELGTPLVGG